MDLTGFNNRLDIAETELMVWNTYKQEINTLKKIKKKEEKIQKRV